MDEQKNIALAILGITAIMAIVGLVLLFKGGVTGEFAYNPQAKRFSQLSASEYAQVSCQKCYQLYGFGTPETENCIKLCSVDKTDSRRYPSYTSAWAEYRPAENPV